jgi:hypothetical protein
LQISESNKKLQHQNSACKTVKYFPSFSTQSDPEVTTKNLLEFCNITMDELPVFNRNNRVVNTASSWQVRQPMYSSSIGRWKRYQSFLEPLMQLEH